MDSWSQPGRGRAPAQPNELTPDAFAGIFELNYDRIWRYLFRLGGRECADELAGEVFLSALSHRDRYDPLRGSVQSWLYGIASNLGRSWLRRRSRGLRAVTRLSQWRRSEDELAHLDGIDGGAQHLSVRSDLCRTLAAMAELSDADREILVLFAWEELSYDEIADVLGIALGTVRSRLSRARTRLRELAGVGDQVPNER